MKTEYVLDASALLSVLLVEPGEDRVREVLDRSLMHAVNVAEVIGKLVRAGVPTVEAVDAVKDFQFEVREELVFEEAAWIGVLMAGHREIGASLGDWVCLVTAARFGSIALTGDRKWKALDGQVFWGMTFRVELIR